MNKSDFKMNIPMDAKEIIKLFEDAGYEAFVVGGCVRDAMLGRVPHDYDICTNATPEQMKAVFSKSGHNTYDTGLQHGTISILGTNDREVYEATTYRIDGEYTDGRHPDGVHFVADVSQDLARRDFTINSMCFNDSVGLVDPFGGAEDLKRGLIRCVGDPDKRFQEDGLRIMRAIRFASTYGFEIEPETKRAIHENKHLLKNVSAERKTVEFVKMLTHAKTDLLMEYGDVFAEFIPEIKPMIGFDQKNPWHNYTLWEHTARAVAATPNDPTLRLAAFFHDIGKPVSFTIDENGQGHFKGHPKESAIMAEDIMRRMKFDVNSIKSVNLLVKHHDDTLAHNLAKTQIKRKLNKFGENSLRQLIAIQRADKQSQRHTRDELENMDPSQMTPEEKVTISELRALDQYENMITEIIDSRELYSLRDLEIDGNDLIELGMKPGKELGSLLNDLLNQVIEDPEMNDRDLLLEVADRYIRSLNGESIAIDLDERG